MNADINIIPRDWEEDNAIIKVIGVGGGGCNAVNYMYKQNIQGCSFIVCNTDAQALSASEVPLIVYTPAVPKDLGEMQKVMNGGYTVVKRSRTLGEITRGQRCLAVAGTHGKTTTSTLTAHILTETGVGCSAFLGGISRNYGTNLLMSHKNNVVVEADEFDRSFP